MNLRLVLVLAVLSPFAVLAASPPADAPASSGSSVKKSEHKPLKKGAAEKHVQKKHVAQ